MCVLLWQQTQLQFHQGHQLGKFQGTLLTSREVLAPSP